MKILKEFERLREGDNVVAPRIKGKRMSSAFASVSSTSGQNKDGMMQRIDWMPRQYIHTPFD